MCTLSPKSFEEVKEILPTVDIGILTRHNTKYVKRNTVLLCLLLFYARKITLFKWKDCKAPNLSFYINLVNKVLPKYDQAYVSQTCPENFDTV